MDIEHFTAEQIIQAIQGTGGLKTKIANRLGCRPSTVTNYLKRYPTVYRAWEAEKERIDDLAEDAHIERLEARDSTHVLFHLKTRCKDRGYGEKVEHTVDGTIEIVVKKLRNVSSDEV